ncbi:MAG: DUF418 domain-containing protein [Alteromonadaceae bacterium]|nr:DUF418 domain-containing protein [Alteromonadaceae bacterium]
MNNHNARILFLDALRGYALLGLFLVHCVEMFEIVWLGNPFGNWAFDGTFAAFGGKAYAIFALLFGVSFYLILRGGEQRQQDIRMQFLWRISLLFVFGVLHGLLYSGDILQILALSGLVLLVLHRLPLWLLSLIAILLLLQLPMLALALFRESQAQFPMDTAVMSARDNLVLSTYKEGSLGDVLLINLWDGFVRKWQWFYQYGRLFNVIGLTLAGYTLARVSFFTRQEQYRRVYWIALIALIVVVELLQFSRDDILGLINLNYGAHYLPAAYGLIVNTGYAFITVLLGLVLYSFAVLQNGVLTLAPVGRMSLTVYLSQSLICIPLFYGFGFNGWQWLNSVTALTMGIAMWFVIMFAARWWMRRYYYGPAEWFWRACTLRDFSLPMNRD